MELFKGSLHYRCALPGYEEPGEALLDLAAEVAGEARRRHLKGNSGESSNGGGGAQSPFDTGLFCNPQRNV